MGAEPPLSSSANQQGGTPRSSQVPAAIELPPYPYDRLEPLKQIALDAHGFGHRGGGSVTEGDVGRGRVRVDLQDISLHAEAVVGTRVSIERNFVAEG